VEESYDGYKLGKTMTKEFIDDMIQRFKNNKRIHKKYVPPLLGENLMPDLPNIIGNKTSTLGRTDDGGNICCKNEYFNNMW
jgi:hypothetical protein